MVDVYLVGFLVAYTRLTGLASVHVDTALFALIGFMVCIAAADDSLDHEAIWRALDRDAPPPPAMQAGDGALIGCHACGLLNHAHAGAPCRRCHATLRPRKTDSLNRTWALLSAAVLLYIPANIYPVMVLTELGRAYPYTIMGGIFELIDEKLGPLALLVFFASIMIPFIKLLALGYMLLATRKGSTLYLVGRTRAFRIIDFIGRWSMIDVFMISILVALVRFGQFADVRAETGAPCFAAVVVLTILAVNAFDPRLMWDAPAARAAQTATEQQRPI
jgi:paraquat-inducible protein A